MKQRKSPVRRLSPLNVRMQVLETKKEKLQQLRSWKILRLRWNGKGRQEGWRQDPLLNQSHRIQVLITKVGKMEGDRRWYH